MPSSCLQFYTTVVLPPSIFIWHQQWQFIYINFFHKKLLSSFFFTSYLIFFFNKSTFHLSSQSIYSNSLSLTHSGSYILTTKKVSSAMRGYYWKHCIMELLTKTHNSVPRNYYQEGSLMCTAVFFYYYWNNLTVLSEKVFQYVAKKV